MPDVIGKIRKPIKYEGLAEKGLVSFLNNVINFIIIIAAIFTLVNFVLAGYSYLSASGNPQKISQAGNKMLQSLLGLIIIAAAFVIAGIIGHVVFGDSSALIQLNLYKVL